MKNLFCSAVFLFHLSSVNADKIICTEDRVEEDLVASLQQQSVFHDLFLAIVPTEAMPNFSSQDWAFLTVYMNSLSKSALTYVIEKAYREVREFNSVITESYEAKWRRILMQCAYAIMVK